MRKRETAGWRRAVEQGESWTEADARAALAACEGSGDSVAVFARRNRVDPRRLYWWRHQLKKGSGASARRPRVSPLIPVTLRVAEPAAGASEKVVVIDGDLRVEIGDASRVAPEWMAELLRRVRGGRE